VLLVTHECHRVFEERGPDLIRHVSGDHLSLLIDDRLVTCAGPGHDRDDRTEALGVEDLLD
jgi:hypothetical protein